MSDELEDFEINPEESRAETRQPRPGRRGGFWLALLVALAALALLAALLFWLFRPARRQAATSPASSAPAATAVPQPSLGPLPALDESDDFARRIAAGLSSHPEFARWLAGSALVRTLTAVVANVADGETPRPHLAFLAPKQRFRATGGNGRRMVADPEGFAGYDGFADAIASVDTRMAAAAFRASEPLFDAAYRDLGHPEGFRSALDRAIEALLAVPVPANDAEIVPHAVGFRWADARLEALTSAQKQFLRTGPRNVRLVQARLRELQSSLRADAASAQAP